MPADAGPSFSMALPTALGAQVAIGPFLVRVRSELPSVGRYLDLLYAGFPLRLDDGGHFEIAIVGGAGPRRWVRRQAHLVVNASRPFLPLPAALAGPLFEWGLNWCIGTRAHRFVAVHAAVVERAGRALVLPAPPGSGKSTLCAALVTDGWRLFSDEFALLDPTNGQVVPVPRPISLKNASIEIIARRDPAAVFGPEGQDMDGARFVHMRPPRDSVRRAHETAPAGWVMFPRYVPGRQTTIEPMTRAESLVGLADQSFNYNYLGPSGFGCLADLVRRTTCHRLEYGDLDDVLRRLRQVTGC